MGDEVSSDIDKDLARTFPSMRRFASRDGLESLRRVLLAYAAYDPEVGLGSVLVHEVVVCWQLLWLSSFLWRYITACNSSVSHGRLHAL